MKGGRKCDKLTRVVRTVRKGHVELFGLLYRPVVQDPSPARLDGLRLVFERTPGEPDPNGQIRLWGHASELAGSDRPIGWHLMRYDHAIRRGLTWEPDQERNGGVNVWRDWECIGVAATRARKGQVGGTHGRVG